MLGWCRGSGIWAGVRKRVEALSGLPGAAKVFGASNHRFVLAAPLAEEQLLSWEAQVGTVLPDQFRAFLTEVAAAGADPQYGLLGLEVTDGIADWVGDHWRGPDRLNLRTEFPHQTEFRRAAPGHDPTARAVPLRGSSCRSRACAGGADTGIR